MPSPHYILTICVVPTDCEPHGSQGYVFDSDGEFRAFPDSDFENAKIRAIDWAIYRLSEKSVNATFQRRRDYAANRAIGDGGNGGSG
jgi:hypothetical protein